MWGIGNKLSWDLVLRKSYYARSLSDNPNKFSPIPTITFAVDSHILLIGARNSQAKSNWFLAGHVSNRLLFSPSSTSDFIAAVQSGSAIKIGLNRLTLVKFTDFNLLPYLLEIDIARWHKEMFLEVWKYSGTPDSVEASLTRIEAKIDNFSN